MLSGGSRVSPSNSSLSGEWECQWLEHIQPAERVFVGDKAFYLSQLAQKGYPVVSGFVVPVQVMWQFLETIHWSEPLLADLPNSTLHLDVDNYRQLQLVAQRLRQEIATANLQPEWLSNLLEEAEKIALEETLLILRPSLTIQGGTNPRTAASTINRNISGLLKPHISSKQPEAFALGLKRVWAELFRAKSLFYWQRMGIQLQQINLAVLVQPLTNAVASGFLNCHPTELEIQASWGLGIAMTQGEVLPDSYSIQIETGAVRSQQLGNKTIAYGLIDSPVQTRFTGHYTSGIAQPPEIYLQSYLLSSAQQQEYALPEKYLQQLIQLAQRLRAEIGSVFALEWVLTQTEDRIPPQLYLTQLNQREPHPLTPSPLKGQAAAAGRIMATAHVVVNSSDKPLNLPPGVILVAPAIAPDWLELLQQAGGVVTEQGGLTCHGAILARELGIPAVVSVREATQRIKTGDSVLLDGDRGEVYHLSQAGVEQELDGMSNEHAPLHASSHASGYIPPPSTSIHTAKPLSFGYPIATQLLVNLSQPSSIEQVRGLPIDGVGLLRSELMVVPMLEGQHPNTWLTQGREAELLERWQGLIIQFARVAPRPIFYRSLDWRVQEFQSFTGNSPVTPEMNPMLGQRGTFSYLQNPTLFDLELRALAAVQQSGYTNVHLILPFVRTVEEFSFCRRRVEQAGLTQVAQFQLWIMAEVPSILFLLPEYVRAGVQGVSIGTNDLTQLLLGVDRDQGHLATAFDERHPVVMQAVAQIIQMARQAGIPCSICGQAPVLYPELIDSLVRWGITSISVEPDAVERTYAAIARAEQRVILAAAREGRGEQVSRWAGEQVGR